MAAGPTQRTLIALRKQGWTAQVVERWNAFAKVRVDLFNAIDIVAIKPGAILGIQATSASNKTARINKIKDEPKMLEWLRAGGQLEVWTWRKGGPKNKRKVWKLTVTEITADELETEGIE